MRPANEATFYQESASILLEESKQAKSDVSPDDLLNESIKNSTYQFS